MMVLWSQSGPWRRIRALQIQTAQKLKFSSTCSEPFISASRMIIITYLYLSKVYLHQIRDMEVVPTIKKHRGKDAQSFHTRLNLSTSDNYEDYHSRHSYENSLIYYPFDRYDLQVMSIVLMWCTHLPRPALYMSATKQTLLHLLETHQQMNQLTWNFLQVLDSSCALPTLHIWFKYLIKYF